MSTLSNLRNAGPAHHLRIAAQGTVLPTHAALWRWLHGDVLNLRISEFTVKNPMKSIFSKLDVSTRAQAVATLTRMEAHV